MEWNYVSFMESRKMQKYVEIKSYTLKQQMSQGRNHKEN